MVALPQRSWYEMFGSPKNSFVENNPFYMKRIALILSLAVFFLLTPSCHRGDRQEQEHHHHDSVQYTAYGADFELFAEAAPFCVDEESEVVAHLTRLVDFKPLDSSQVTIRLRVGDKVVSQTLDHPAQPGIYKFALTPSHAGCGELMVEVLLPGGVSEVCCHHVHVAATHAELHEHSHEHGEVHEHKHSHGETHEHSHVHAHAHEHSHTATNAISFPKEQSWKIDFATDTLRLQPFGSVIKAAGQVLPSQGDEREATATASGVVVYSNPNLVEGTAVKAGQPLFIIESNGMADNNMSVRLQEATAGYTAAKAEYERKLQLSEDRIVSQAELQRAKATYEAAKAAYDNLKGNFSQKGAVVRAPISGYIQRINVSNGGYVEAGHSVVSVSQNRDLLIRAEVQPRYYSQLAHINSVNFVVPGDPRVYSLAELGGSLVSFAKSTDLDCPLVPVTFRVRNQGCLLSGSFVSLYITTGSDRQALAIPNQGIVEEMGNFFVFVQITPESFEKRLVSLGATDGRSTEILSGVQAGERVVTQGASMVRLAQNGAALDPHAGHVH